MVTHPDILGGDPVFRGTRVPVHVIAAMLEQGPTATDPLPPVSRRFDVSIAGGHRHAELRYDGRGATTLTL